MGERIRQLEDALAILQAKHSNEPHPLLRDDALTTTKTEPQFNEGNALSRETAQKPGDVIEAFGTLSVYDRGVSRFFGPSGGAEVRGHSITVVCRTICQDLRILSIRTIVTISSFGSCAKFRLEGALPILNGGDSPRVFSSWQ